MKKINPISFIENLLWLLNPCLIVLSIFSSELHLGKMLSWLGQWHPVLLHFPIVIGIFVSIYVALNFKPTISVEIEKYVFSLNALFASIVAMLGIFLSIGGNYDKSLLTVHQWGGVSIALFAWIFVLIQKNSFAENKILRNTVALLYLITIIFFTHKGGQLTHGKEALSIPKAIQTVANNKPDSLLTVYEKAVQPILLDKCVSCHGGDKIKGDLQLTSIEFIKKGGKHKDPIVDRIHLPLNDEKHMPPTDKKQLTKDELAILTKWLELGGDLNKALKNLNKTDSLYILAAQYVAPSSSSINKEQADLSPYNNNYVSVQYNYHGGDKINVNFFQGAFYKTEFLQKLEKIKDQIATLNMQSIPLKKSDIDIIATFSNLEKLNLNFTKLNITDISALNALKKLQAISLVGMSINNEQLQVLLKGSNIKKIQLWANGLKQNDIAPLVSKYPAIQFVVGDNLEDSVMKLNKPIIEQDSTIISNHINVPLKHFLKGVIIKYTLDDTEPDSLNSPTYSKPIIVTKNTTLKAKVFKKGWAGSDVIQKSFYKSELNPDTIIMLTKPDPKYIGNGGQTIIDHELGDLSFGNGKWLGYSKTNMEFVMRFNKATAINEIIFNALINTGSYIFPIQTIQVEASDDGKQYKNIQNADFTSITKAYTKEPNINQAQAFKIKVQKGKPYKYYKFTLRNLKKLPLWHPGKGTPAWIFVDEVFFN